MNQINSISDAVRNYFQVNQWEFEQEGNIFHTGVGLDGRVKGVMINAVVSEKAFSVIVVPDIDIPADALRKTEQYTSEINTLLGLGCFFVDKEQHLLVFRMGMICADAVPTPEQVDAMFGYSISTVEDAGEAVLDLVQGRISAEEAAQRTMGDDSE